MRRPPPRHGEDTPADATEPIRPLDALVIPHPLADQPSMSQDGGRPHRVLQPRAPMAPTRSVLTLTALAGASALVAWGPPAAPADEGFPIRDSTIVESCSRCHQVDDEGRMGRISYLRKTPEGWQTSLIRMVSLHGVELEPAKAREIVRYLANEQGLAPEELAPGAFEVERRRIEYDYEGDSQVEYTCMVCHSLGRVITQRRTGEEWGLLLATHRALYPLVDRQAFRRSGPPPSEPGPDGAPPDARHPMDRAIDHLSRVFPLETPEWSAWAATKRSPRLAGAWSLEGYAPGKGPVYGSVTVTSDPNDPDAFTTAAAFTYAESGRTERRSGQALVYTGYQWRGRSNPGTDAELREVMTVSRDQRTVSGRWFTGAYDEIGFDVTLRRVSGAPTVVGIHPRAIARGATVEVRLLGTGLTAATPSDLDFGAGVTVGSVRGPENGSLSVLLTIDPAADVGARDLFSFGNLVEAALIVHDGVDRLTVTPESGMARVGGANAPKGLQTFDAIGWNDGPDDEPETDDDLELGRVPVTWSLEEYAAAFGDDDLSFVGAVGADGTFTPALDGPNPARAGNRNNLGDVWVVATHARSGVEALRARAHLLVTVPNFMRFDPWREAGR